MYTQTSLKYRSYLLNRRLLRRGQICGADFGKTPSFKFAWVYRLFLFFFPLSLLVSAPYDRYAPPEPIQQEITPPVSPLPTNEYDITLDAEVLWWTGNVTNLSYATTYLVAPLGNNRTAMPKKIDEIEWDWSPGVRVALGVNTNYDGWDVTGDWTYFQNSFGDSKSVPAPVQTIENPRGNPEGTQLVMNGWSEFDTDNSGTRISLRGAFQMNQMDLEVGRNFYLSRFLSVRPYGGVRGHLSHLNFRNKRRFEGSNTSFQVGLGKWNDHFKQQFWGVGPLVGVESSWRLGKNLAIFGMGGFSLLYVPNDHRVHYKTFALSPDRTEVYQRTRHKVHRDRIWSLQQVLDLALGIRIEGTWAEQSHQEALRMMLDVGWEAHIYPSYAQFSQTQGFSGTFGGNSSISSPNTYLPSNGKLTLSGIIVRGRFEF